MLAERRLDNSAVLFPGKSCLNARVAIIFVGSALFRDWGNSRLIICLSIISHVRVDTVDTNLKGHKDFGQQKVKVRGLIRALLLALWSPHQVNSRAEKLPGKGELQRKSD